MQEDRVGAARAHRRQDGAVVRLKGARTRHRRARRPARGEPDRQPRLGTGGTGDVLTGVVAAALARMHDGNGRVDPFAAACAAVYLHGAAGDRAAAQRSQTGLVAGDVIDALPHLLAAR